MVDPGFLFSFLLSTCCLSKFGQLKENQGFRREGSVKSGVCGQASNVLVEYVLSSVRRVGVSKNDGAGSAGSDVFLGWWLIFRDGRGSDSHIKIGFEEGGGLISNFFKTRFSRFIPKIYISLVL